MEMSTVERILLGEIKLETNFLYTNKINGDTSKVICNGFGCSEYATEKINVNAGKFGSIEVQVCSKCRHMLKKKEEMFSEKLSLADPLSLKQLENNHRHDTGSRGFSNMGGNGHV